MAENVAAGPGSNLEQTPGDSRQDRAREAGHLHPVADSRHDYTVEKDGLIMVGDTGRTGVNQQLGDCVKGYPRHAGN